MTNPIVTTEWVAEHLEDPRVRLLEISSEVADTTYRQGRIPGAHHLNYWRGPFGERQREFNEGRLLELVGKSEEFVVYSSDTRTPAAYASARAIEIGFRKVHYFEGGLNAWKAAGYPVETEY